MRLPTITQVRNRTIGGSVLIVGSARRGCQPRSWEKQLSLFELVGALALMLTVGSVARRQEMEMLKTVFAAVILLPFIASPILAQPNPHHYQGGPRSDPHHMSEWPKAPDAKPKKQVKPKAVKQYPAHRYQGGPKAPGPHQM